MNDPTHEAKAAQDFLSKLETWEEIRNMTPEQIDKETRREAWKRIPREEANKQLKREAAKKREQGFTKELRAVQADYSDMLNRLSEL